MRPVYVEVAEDIWLEESSDEEVKIETEKPKASEEEVEKVAEMLREAKRPLILAGFGVNSEEGSRLLTKLVEKTSIPVATTGNGRERLMRRHFMLGQSGIWRREHTCR